MKKLCSVHHFYYVGEECPFCVKEKYVKLSKKYLKDDTEKNKKETVKVEREITSKDLEKLKAKFGCK